MRLIEWEPTIQEMTDEYNHEPTEGRKNKVLFGWRTKLKKEPTCLQPQQIDEIVREVRRRHDDRPKEPPSQPTGPPRTKEADERFRVAQPPLSQTSGR